MRRRARGAHDRLVRDALGVARRLAARRVAVVHDDVRDLARVADLGEQRDVPFAGAVDDRDRLPVGVVAERAEHERERELLRSPLDEHHRAREEDLGALGVELRDQRGAPASRGSASGCRSVVPVRWSWRTSTSCVEPVDAEEDGRVGRVEHLVAAARGEAVELRVQVALRGRAQVELRLLDQDHVAADARVGERGDRRGRATGPPSSVCSLLHDRRGALRLAVGRARAATSAAGSPGRTAPAARLRGSGSASRAAARRGRASGRRSSASTWMRVYPCETSATVGIGAAASSSVHTAERTVDLPDDDSPTSTHTAPGTSSTSRAPR